ncbi:BZ3500_MvSof-1268-A1-R1_Chr1-2g01403 [Microbotryum saponariae]|uniref:Alkyl transferase n=1 Tax=Microbotryum saponariae TaxID=289078 RepID=A0A2X0KT73_9BASI|nr:BZ3500_MvSof-1268-A1-R1_Chr1-2g01403 [Microbotryum saponariae]SCZ97329.1 BZ3501_MvSof-1269-A2-R1_Chr1-2g01002 [Microbotryum saponariae]
MWPFTRSNNATNLPQAEHKRNDDHVDRDDRDDCDEAVHQQAMDSHPLDPTLAEPQDVPLPFRFSTSSFLSLIPEVLHGPLRTLLIHSLRLGPLPPHIAFIMDGNRRSARLRSLPVQVGHQEGFEALKRVLSFLLKLGICNVTVYAFSIENFNRPPDEVDALMDMARERLVEICQKGALLDRHGVQIRILGRRDLLPEDVQIACSKAEELTQHNTKGVLNFCCPYTSQEEMLTSIKRASRLPHSLTRPPATCSEITDESLSSHLYTSHSPPVDILLRTSAVSRLSDFLLYQSNEDTVLHFIEPNWPDIGVVDVLGPVLVYQSEEVVRRLRTAVGWMRG